MNAPIQVNPPKLSGELRISAHDDGAVILDIRKGKIFTANAIGARILARLREDRTVDLIVDEICDEFSIARPQVEMDVHHFVDRLRTRGLLTA